MKDKIIKKMSLAWLNLCRESLRISAAKIMEIYATDKRSVGIAVGEGGDRTLIADRAAEDIIIEKLSESPEDVRLISEEAGEVVLGKKPRYTIFLDPLDGSFNFKNELPYFGISMSVMDREARRHIVSYVINVFRGTEYYATEDGAYKNLKKIAISRRSKAERLLMEFNSRTDPEDLRVVPNVLLKMRHVRAPGAVSLDLCSVADGTFDCLLFTGVSRYLDLAAGIHILEKSGGVVSDFTGDRNIHEGKDLKINNMIASGNEDLHESILFSINSGKEINKPR
jgi:myo-inositol-1(or 4)-monophosphatase